MFGKSLLHLVPLCIACLVSPSVHGTSTHVTRQVLADFTSGGPTGTAVSDTNSPARGASSSVRTVTSYEGSNRLQMTDGGYVNGFYITFSGALQSEGNYLVTARVKVVNSSSAPISSFGLAVKSGAASTSKISDVNAGYVMNLATHSTDGATLGWQTIGAAVQASGTFPQDLTVYFSTDPSRGNHSSVPTTDGDFENAHRDSSALLWGSGAAVYIDDVTLVGPGNMGEDRHVWVNLYDGASDALTNQASLENILVTARNNHMNCIDIMARFRANRYYRKNRDYSTYPNNEPYGSGASDAFVHFGGRIPAPLQSLGN